MKAEGKIRHIGFSFHDSYEVFEEIINYYNWDFCQIQYNYMDTDVQAGSKGYELAKTKNIPIVIMEPFKGGVLANLPDEVSKEFKNAEPEYSTASWSLRWLSAHDNIKVILSVNQYIQIIIATTVNSKCSCVLNPTISLNLFCISS